MKKYLAEMVGTMVLIISILLCSCCRSKQHAVIKADLVKVFDNYPLTSKGDENYTREIHLVFRITNTTNDTFFIPMQAMGYECNSKIYFSVDSLKCISFATFSRADSPLWGWDCDSSAAGVMILSPCKSLE